MPTTVFLIGLDTDIRDAIMTQLVKEGCRVNVYDSVSQCSSDIENDNADMIICGNNVDIMTIRLVSGMPVMVLSASGSINDKIKAYKAGCDDYIVWPCDPIEIGLRVGACVNRIRRSEKLVMDFPPLSINIKTREVFLCGKEVRLTNREFEILSLLAETPNKVVSIKDIFNKVWDDNAPCDNHLVMVNVSYIRKKFAKIAPGLSFLKTHWGHGYTFEYPPKDT